MCAIWLPMACLGYHLFLNDPLYIIYPFCSIICLLLFFSTVLRRVSWLLNLICIFFLMRVSDTALMYEEGRRHYNLRNNRFACMVGMPQLPYIATANSTPHRLSVDNNKEKLILLNKSSRETWGRKMSWSSTLLHTPRCLLGLFVGIVVAIRYKCMMYWPNPAIIIAI